MSDTDYTLGSGAKLHVTTARYADAKNLIKTLARCAKGLPMNEDLLKADISSLKDYVVEAVASDEVEAAVFACARSVSYDNVKVTPELFDDPKIGAAARQDHYEIMFRIIQTNCAPFFVKTFSVLKARMAGAAGSPTSA